MADAFQCDKCGVLSAGRGQQISECEIDDYRIGVVITKTFSPTEEDYEQVNNHPLSQMFGAPPPAARAGGRGPLSGVRRVADG